MDVAEGVKVGRRRQRLFGLYACRKLQASDCRNRLHSLQSLCNLTASYSKRQGPAKYSYATKDAEVVSEKSPYQTNLDHMHAWLAGGSIEGEGILDNQTCCNDSVLIDERIMIERTIRTLNRVMNDRMSSLWSLKVSMSNRMIHAVFVHVELHGTAVLFSKLLQSTKTVLLQLLADDRMSFQNQYLQRVLGLLDDSLKRQIPQYCSRLQSYLNYTAKQNISVGLNQFLSTNRRAFVVVGQQDRRWRNLFAMSCAWSLSGVSSTTILEQQLNDIVSHPLESLDGAYTKITQAMQLKDSEHMRSLHAEDLYAAVVDCSLVSLMECVMEHPSLEFNELGVYRLLRVVQQLQCFLATVKLRMNWSVVVKDPHVWRRAERVLKVLGSSAQGVGGEPPSDDNLLSRTEEQRWRDKVQRRRSGCGLSEGGNAGSIRVFAALELQYDNL